MNEKVILPPAKIKIESIQSLKYGDLDDLCDSTESAITEGGGFGWIKVPSRKVLENYWRGVLTIPERELIIGRLDNVVAGSCQLIKPSKNNEAQKNSCSLIEVFESFPTRSTKATASSPNCVITFLRLSALLTLPANFKVFPIPHLAVFAKFFTDTFIASVAAAPA